MNNNNSNNIINVVSEEPDISPHDFHELALQPQINNNENKDNNNDNNDIDNSLSELDSTQNLGNKQIKQDYYFDFNIYII